MHTNSKISLLVFLEKGFCMRGEFCPFDHGNDPLVVEDVNMPGIVLGFPHGAHPPGFMPERPPLNPAGSKILHPIISYLNCKLSNH